MTPVPKSTPRQAPPGLRDRFLNALDQRDQASIREAVHDLMGCVNLLPGDTCVLLGLAPGSTYGDAALAITNSQDAAPDAV